MRKGIRTASIVFAVLALTALLVVSCVSSPSAVDKFMKPDVQITFLETSDVHGAIFPYNFITGKPLDTSMAQVATYVNQQRASGAEVVLLDNGDSLQGQPTVYYYNFEKTNVPHIWSEVLNFMKYDAVTVANHDIEAGHPVYDKLRKEMAMPFMSANLVDEKTMEPYFTPYTVVVRKGIKIAILGLSEPGIARQLPKQFWEGMKILDMIETAKKWIPIIQEKEKPDLIVGLFHAGVDYTYGGETAATPNNESASQLVVEQVPGFDFILVGHDHTGWMGMGWDPVAKKNVYVKNPAGKIVPIYGPNAGASNVINVTVNLNWNKATKSYDKVIKGNMVSMKGVAVDPAFSAKFDPYKAEILTWVNRPIGKMAGKMTSEDAMFGDSAFVDLIHRIQLELCADPSVGLKPAQISFVAPLSATASLPTTADGTVLVRDMFSLYVYENYLYTMNLTGKQILDYMEFNYDMWMNTMTSENDHLINFAKDPEGKPLFNARYNSYDTATRSYNWDTVAGIKYTVDVSKTKGSRVTIISMMDGTPFDLAKTYSVAINSYRGSGGGNHLVKGSGFALPTLQKLELVTSSTTKDLRYYMLKWFERQSGTISMSMDNNWKVIPEAWAAKGRTTDYPLLYPAAVPAAK